MSNVWIMTGWSDGADGDVILNVYDDFEVAADKALKMIKEIEEEARIHGEPIETKVETQFADGQASYFLLTRYNEANPLYVQDKIELRRYEVTTKGS